MKTNTKKTLLSPNVVKVVSSVSVDSSIKNVNANIMYAYKVNLNTKKIFDIKFISNAVTNLKNIDLTANERILLDILKNGIKTGTVVAVSSFLPESNKYQIKYRILGYGKYKGKEVLVAKADKNITQELLKAVPKNDINKISKYIKIKDNISILYLDPNTLERLNKDMYLKLSANLKGNSFEISIKMSNN